MKTVRMLREPGILLSLLLFCSCASTPNPAAFAPASDLPAAVAQNAGAGRGGPVTIMLRLESGEEFAMFVDTGSPITLLPKSLEPKLGKRLGTETVLAVDGKEKVSLYAAPRLFLGNTQLITSKRAGVWNGRFGILGMDCLRHYCLQLDFQAGQLRFFGSGTHQHRGLGPGLSVDGFQLCLYSARRFVSGNG